MLCESCVHSWYQLYGDRYNRNTMESLGIETEFAGSNGDGNRCWGTPMGWKKSVRVVFVKAHSVNIECWIWVVGSCWVSVDGSKKHYLTKWVSSEVGKPLVPCFTTELMLYTVMLYTVMLYTVMLLLQWQKKNPSATGGTGVSGLTRGLATLPPRWIQEPSVVTDRDERPQVDPLAVHCFCVCSGSVLLGDLFWVTRSREHDLPSVLSIYPRIFLCIFIVYRHVVRILCLLYSAICWLLWFSCQYLPSDWLERPLWGHLNMVRRLPPQSPGGRECLCVFFFCLFCLCSYVFPPGPTQYIFHTTMTQYSLFVLKVSLNTNKTYKQTNAPLH